jgi:hypothetical protein
MRLDRIVRPVWAELVNGGTTGQGSALATTAVGSSTTVEAIITGSAATHVLRGSVVVALPGSGDSAGAPAQLASNAAIRPENQIVEGRIVVDAVACGQRLDVTFQPAEPGVYPVYFIAQLCFSEAHVRDERDRDPRWLCQELGSIFVR